jgi:hypothetical protein
MLDEKRWLVEVEIMKRYFPSFKQLQKDGSLGFYGSMQGPRSGRLYKVVVKNPVQRFPFFEPALYIRPLIGQACDSQGRLSYVLPRRWDAARSTFANCVLVAFTYLREQRA